MGWTVRVMTRAEIAQNMNLGVCGNTLHTHIGSMVYHKCIACSKRMDSGKLAPKRNDSALVMKEPQNWRRVRFFDKVH
jgi:hypothetical protein